MKIDFSKVESSYNGKSGCMCGCNGKYTLPAHVDRQKANEAMKYEAYDESDVSDRRVKIAISKIEKALAKHGITQIGQEIDRKQAGGHMSVGITEDYAWVDEDGRNTVVYFKKFN